MPSFRPLEVRTRKAPLLGSLLDKVIHPFGDPKPESSDPGRPFTPPVSQPSKQERDDDDKNGPNFPMDPALA
jgi:hypothetical protein